MRVRWQMQKVLWKQQHEERDSFLRSSKTRFVQNSDKEVEKKKLLPCFLDRERGKGQ